MRQERREREKKGEETQNRITGVYNLLDTLLQNRMKTETDGMFFFVKRSNSKSTQMTSDKNTA